MIAPINAKRKWTGNRTNKTWDGCVLIFPIKTSPEISENLLCRSFLLHQDNKALLCSVFPTQATLRILKLIMCKESLTKALVSIPPDKENAKACPIHGQNLL